MTVAGYTTQVRTICEQAAGKTDHVSFPEIEAVITAALPSVFPYDFPIYEGGTCAALERKILRRYWMREIGTETVGMWKFMMNERLQRIMPYYVDLYRHNVNAFVLTGDVDLYREIVEEMQREDQTGGTSRTTGTDVTENDTATTKTGSRVLTRAGATTRTGSETLQGTRTPNLTTKDKYSDTPQGGTTGLDSDGYLTNYRNVQQTGTEGTSETKTYNQVKDQESGSDTETFQNITDTQSGTVTGRDDHTRTDAFSGSGSEDRQRTEHVHGIQDAARYLSLKEKLMDLVINIDNLIIQDLADLFFNLY